MLGPTYGIMTTYFGSFDVCILLLSSAFILLCMFVAIDRPFSYEKKSEGKEHGFFEAFILLLKNKKILTIYIVNIAFWAGFFMVDNFAFLYFELHFGVSFAFIGGCTVG